MPIFKTLETYIRDCFRFREALYHLFFRDLKIKYKRTVLGYVWSLLNPVLQLAVLTFVFSHAMGKGVKDYALYLFSGLLPWTFFSTSVIMSAMCLVENEAFLKKIYMPKLIFPIARMLLRLVDFLFSLLALSLLAFVLGFPLKATVIAIPAAILILFVFTFGLSVFMSVATVYFRDIEYLLGVCMQLLYFISPILYQVNMLPQRYHWVLQVNPVYSQLNLFQKLIYYGQLPTPGEWGTAIGISLCSLGLGMVTLASLDEDLVFRM